MKDLKYILKRIIIIIIVIGVLYLIENPNLFQKKELNNNFNILEIEIIDVGQADSILIRYKNENILIDAGNNKDGPKLVEYLKSLDINKFKYVFVTHNHEDHIGGMDDIIRNFDIEHFYMTKTETEYTTYKEVIKELNNHNIIKEIPYIDEEFKIDDIKLTLLWIGEDKDNLNENSMVLKLDYKNTSYLFEGDLQKEEEEYLLDKDIKSDLLKVSHHGSYDASSIEFLEKVSPKYAIISVEEGNDYGFPHETTLKKLQNIDSIIYRTDQDGTIIIKSDGNIIEINTIKTDTNQKENKK